MVCISRLLEVYQVPALPPQETIQQGESSKDRDKHHGSGQHRVGQAWVLGIRDEKQGEVLTCSTVSKGGDAEQEPDPQADIEVEGDDAGYGDEAQEGKEVA